MKLLRFLPAVGLLNRCLSEYPDDVRALNWRGWVMEQLQHEEAAVKDYERALELARPHGSAHSVGGALLES